MLVVVPSTYKLTLKNNYYLLRAVSIVCPLSAVNFYQFKLNMERYVGQTITIIYLYLYISLVRYYLSLKSFITHNSLIILNAILNYIENKALI